MEIVIALSSFWQAFILAAAFLTLAFFWGFAIVDLLMQAMPGWKKALWLLVIIFIPIIGALVYLVVRPDPVHHVKEGIAAGRERYEESVGARTDLMDRESDPRVQ